MSLLLAAELPEVGAATGSAGLAWLLVAFPAAGALVLFLAGRRADAWGHVLGVLTVVASFVSPYRASREFIRRLCPGFLEIFVATPLDECERRDVKGLYARARRGEIRNFTGIDDPYEPPDHPELTLDTRALSVDQCVDRVLDRLGGDR